MANGTQQFIRHLWLTSTQDLFEHVRIPLFTIQYGIMSMLKNQLVFDIL